MVGVNWKQLLHLRDSLPATLKETQNFQQHYTWCACSSQCISHVCLHKASKKYTV